MTAALPDNRAPATRLLPRGEVIRELRTRGLALCKIDPTTKQPSYKGWSTRSLEPTEFATNDMVGVLCGPLSSGNKLGHALVVLDLDAADAVRRADDYLPGTAMMEGRSGKPNSHRYFLIPFESIPEWAESGAAQAAGAAKRNTGHPGPFTKSFRHRDTNAEVLKFIGTGGQTVCPPSLHPSGEVRQWAGGSPGEPAVVSFSKLWEEACELANACDAVIPDVVPRPPRSRITPHVPDIRDRASKYLAKLPPAISGDNGHATTFWAARCLVYAFDLDPDLALSLLVSEYNPRCQPPWSEQELRHKIDNANRCPFAKQPRGWLRDQAIPERNGTYSDNGKATAATIPTRASVVERVAPPAFPFITSDHFAGGDYRPEWLVKNALVRGQPGVIAGPSKALKTNLSIDLAVSLACGKPFLGKFDIAKQTRVAVVSGESGAHTIQETAHRVCKAKGVTLADQGDRLHWCFTLPTFSDLGAMTAFAGSVANTGAEVVVIDPVYLALGDIDAKNLFEAGAAFRVVAEVLLKVGCTPILVHHANRQLKVGEMMELSHLAYSGLEQFARQFILLNRRMPYEGDGRHDLWFNVGGSAGHGGLWSLHVEEGTVDEQFGGRVWNVEVQTLTEAKQEVGQEREVAKTEAARRKQVRDEAAVLDVIDAEVSKGQDGATKNSIRDAGKVGMNSKRITDVIGSLLEKGVVEEVKFEKKVGQGGGRAVTGYRRVPVPKQGHQL